MPKSSKKDRKTKPYGWIWAIFLISGCMFTVGVLVGRGNAPVEFDIQQLQNEIKALKAKEKKAQASRHKIEPGFYEALKKPVETAPPPAPKVVAKKQPAPAPVKKETAKPPAPKKDSPKETPKALRELGGSDKPLTIQVSSLKDHTLAQRTANALKSAGYNAYVITAMVPGKGVWHRVRIGAFADKKEAAPIMKQLKTEGRKPIIVTK
jgi:cell division septation protein DedD